MPDSFNKNQIYFLKIFCFLVAAGGVSFFASPLSTVLVLTALFTFFLLFPGEAIRSTPIDSSEEKERKVLSQIAHDLRSPLAALEVLTDSIHHLPEEKRILLRSSLSRLQDIANQLVKNPERSIAVNAALLSPLLESLVSEKRIQYRNRMGIEILGRFGASAYGVFAALPASEFKIMLSQCVDKAIEKIEGNGTLIFTLDADSTKAKVILECTSPISFSEVIFPATLQTAVRLSQETPLRVAFEIEEAPPPSWFVQRLMVRPQQKVIVIDDDASIHQVWETRFESFKKKGVELVHFSNPDEFVEKFPYLARKADLYLVDYEFLSFKRNGIQLIEELKLNQKAILVTSHFEEESLQKDLVKYRLRMIPKGQAAFVSIDYFEGTSIDFVLIDDDILVRESWRMKLERSGKKGWYLESFDPLQIETLPLETPIFIDVSLKDGVNGVDVLRTLYSHGFRDLYLATGYDASEYLAVREAKAILGKEPPDWL